MNAIELYHQDGRSAGVFYCAKCRLVRLTKEEAETCCEPLKCKCCGKETGRKYYLTCEPCDLANEARKEAERFEKAKKVTEWDGWVYLEGTGNDGYSQDLEDFWDSWESDHAEDDEKPKYVWACKAIHFVAADESDVIDRIQDNAPEDFDPADLQGLPELRAAIEQFNEANKDVVAYTPDYSTAILLK
jgi:hypothetical protein